MAMTISEMQEKLRDLPGRSREAIKQAMTDSVQDIEGQAKRNAPVRTGTLRRSISSKVEETGNEVRGIVGAGVEYAEAVHEGTSERPGNPFILNAIKEKENDTIRRLSEAIEKSLTED